MFGRHCNRMASSSVALITNRLINEKSAYLLQHAHNPVDWYPWGKEAFEKARRESKPIFLSVGYSTCHWCHVMERESFESEDVAQVLNENFIPVKVDREERPDIDKQYMTYLQATTGSGGWPMSVWLAPNLQGIMAGTYFPPEDKRFYGMFGFKTVLQKFSDAWQRQQGKMTEQAALLTNNLRASTSELLQGDIFPSNDIGDRLSAAFQRRYQSEFGGFSKAPKFPQPGIFSFLFRQFLTSKLKGLPNYDSLNSGFHTLEMMAKGGIYDFIGKGFHRYSTDDQWHVPHFEKMLYDQGQLACVYSEAYMLNRDSRFKQVLEGIITYMIKDLWHPSGGFYSAEDADSYPDNTKVSNKTEGAFYVWTYDEIESVLKDITVMNSSSALSEIFSRVFNVEKNGNVDPMKDPHHELKHKNVLIRRESFQQLAKQFNISEQSLSSEIEKGRLVLKKKRDGRPRPHRDEKFVAAWNGMAISGLAKAGKALGQPELIQKAVEAADFVRSHLVNHSTRQLYRTVYTEKSKNGDVPDIIQLPDPIHAICNDYCSIIAGLLDLYEASLNTAFLEWANDLQELQNALFWDSSENRLSYYISNNPDLLFSLKDEQDGAEPGNNSIASLNLLRLADYVASTSYRRKAEAIFTTYSEFLEKATVGLPHMVAAFLRYQASNRYYIICGSAKDDLWPILSPIFDPFSSVFVLDDEYFKGKFPWLDKIQSKCNEYNGVVVCEAGKDDIYLNTEDGCLNYLKTFTV